ncbi:hypothetical protein B0H34DRAFT_484210 [Crassisporium funariophilum]|nr:hypothetical protein B0H34DRAFT_484210 [Crassisporium funariophilum]
MVYTRSAAKKQLEEERWAGKSLGREGTVIEITPSATGQGTHIRWLRQSEHNDTPEVLCEDLNVDPRFVTPSPVSKPLGGSPPPLQRQPRISNPGIYNAAKAVYIVPGSEVERIVQWARINNRDLAEEFQYRLQEDDNPFTSSGLPSVSKMGLGYQDSLRFPATLAHTGKGVALGPQGTHLNITDSFPAQDFNSSALDLNANTTFVGYPKPTNWHAPQRLHRSDTVLLLNDNGHPLVPDNRPHHATKRHPEDTWNATNARFESN